MKIPGVIVLYNPNITEVISNLNTYLEFLEVLYVFDNSDVINQNKLIFEEVSSKIIYITYKENKGIAFALNNVLTIVKKSGIKWILTMDQDSSFKLRDAENYLSSIENEGDSKIGLFCPFYPGESFDQSHFFTSGSLMNVDAWLKVGEFDENLFIDEVDGDFNYRLLQCNYKLKKVHGIVLTHELGSKIQGKFLGKIITSDNHSSLRKYYIARNRVYLMKKRPTTWSPYFFDSLIKMGVFILIEKDKKKKFIMILKGVFDGLTNRMGKYKSK